MKGQRGKERPLMQNHFLKTGESFVLDRLVLLLVSFQNQNKLYSHGLFGHAPHLLQVPVNEVHLSVRRAGRRTAKTGYYMPSHIVKLKEEQ